MIDEALKHYNLMNPEVVFIRHNENMTYGITDGEIKYLLRIHTAAEGLDFSLNYGDVSRQVFIESEIDLLSKLHRFNGIKTQVPIKNIAGDFVTLLNNGNIVTMLSWIDGTDLVNSTITEDLVYQIGQMIGNLHNATATITNVERCYYDEVYIDKMVHEISKAYELNHIDHRSYELMKNVLIHIRQILINEKQNFLLIHADLSKSNMICENGKLSPIDFSLSGYGIPEMELGNIISSLHKDEFIPSLIAGYESTRMHPINTSYVKAFIALSVIGYIVIHHNRGYQDEKFINSMGRWCDTLFEPVCK